MFRSFCTGALVLALAAPALADTYSVDPAHTSAEFAVKHLAISTVRGYIPVTKGTVVTTGTSQLPASLEATLDLKGIDTRNEQRDGDLKSAHWFDTDKYPTMTFKSTKIEGTDPANFKIDGDLTFHGVTKPVMLDAKLEGKATMRSGKTKLAYVATTTVDRHLWAIKSDNALSDAAVGNDITITIETEVAQQ